MPRPKKRTHDVRIRVTEELYDRSQAIATLLGMPLATCASMAFSQWVTQQERALTMVQTMADSLGTEVGGAMGRELKSQLEQMNLFEAQNRGPKLIGKKQRVVKGRG